MARVQNTLIGAASGSIGGATFSRWKGINVLKEKASTVANPNTPNQIMRRSALSQVVVIFRQIVGAVNAGFKKLAVGKSEWNAFGGYNMSNGFNFSAPPAATLTPATILVSKGTISTTAITSFVTSRAANTIVANFPTTAPDPGQSVTDKAIIVCYNVTQNDWTGSTTAAARSTGTANIVMPAAWIATDVLRNYLGFYNELSGESSDSLNAVGVVAV